VPTTPINGQTTPINGQITPINGQTTPFNGQTTPIQVEHHIVEELSLTGGGRDAT
jgi:hypothetical protein